MYVCLSIHLPIYLSAYVLICCLIMSVCLFIYPYIHPGTLLNSIWVGKRRNESIEGADHLLKLQQMVHLVSGLRFILQGQPWLNGNIKLKYFTLSLDELDTQKDIHLKYTTITKVN